MPFLWIWALLLFSKVVAGDVCTSQRYTEAGECCKVCPPGTRVLVACGKENTQCEPCQEGVTYSNMEDSPECQVCGKCPRATLVSCNVTHNVLCECVRAGHYRWGDPDDTLCMPCSTCPRGSGVAHACGGRNNTVCEECVAGVSFSEEPRTSKPCTNCTRCKDSEVELRACTPKADAICMDKQLHFNTRPMGADGARDPLRRPSVGSTGEDQDDMEEAAAASPRPPHSSVPRLTPHEEEAGGSNILVYVSVLAAVVLGLLLYVAYKCWRSCQQKQALSKARAAELNNAPEGEKLHSDSGVFLDSHSLQDTQPSKGSKRDSKQDLRLYVNLPPHRKEEVERALAEGGGCSPTGGAGGRGGWRALAEALGYEQERTDLFGRGEDPVRTLLSDWAQQEGSTLGLLCSALTRIERPDVATLVTSPAQGVSVV
ncbi:tumor necrosis factor receptor superfamily member 16 [Engraulis encrasicolus]|uniref:tumor necrosis factor receptor superfamily member 16 n=1 Tax=Engraulis encrasicolus TaxID=184585 RepID=UPI002FD6A708